MALSRAVLATVLLCQLFAASLASPVDRAEDCGQLEQDEVCCGGRPYKRDGDKVCCELQHHTPGEKVFVFWKLCVDGYTDNQLDSCGGHPFDTRYDGCCGGNTLYRKSRSRCCVGSSHFTVVDIGAICCNGHGLKAEQLCCHVPVNKTHASHTHCCLSDDLDPHTHRDMIQTFDNSTHYCDSSEGQLHPIPEVSNEDDYDLSKDCLDGREEEEKGEKLQCCGLDPFRPSQKICCLDSLHNMPSSTSVCCFGEAFAHDDLSNPCQGQCGGRPLNSETQLCCNDKVFNVSSQKAFCCGGVPVNPDTHQCCRGMVLERNGYWSCCHNTLPFHPDTMRCEESGSVTLRQGKLRQRSIGHQVCTMTLPIWGETWSALIDPKMVRLEGRVDSCGTRRKRGKLTLTLTPVLAGVGGEEVSRCLGDKGLKLVLWGLPRNCSKRRVQRSLKGATLEILVRAGKPLHCRKGWAVLDVKDGDAALILRSRKMDRLMKDAATAAAAAASSSFSSSSSFSTRFAGD